MSKLCPKCGAQLDENVNICESCGAEMSEPETQNSANSQPEVDKVQSLINKIKSMGNTVKEAFLKLDLVKRILVIAGASAVVLTAVAVAMISGSGGKTNGTGAGKGEGGGKSNDIQAAKTVAMEYVNACINGDSEKAVSYFPDFKFEDVTREERTEQFDAYLEALLDEYAKFTKLSASYKNIYELDVDNKAKTLEKLKQYSDFDESKLTAYKYVGVTVLKESIDGGGVVDTLEEVILIKYDGKWYVQESTWPR